MRLGLGNGSAGWRSRPTGSHPGRELKDNPSFVVTNLRGDPQRVYERVYCQRGEIENRIKEL